MADNSLTDYYLTFNPKDVWAPFDRCYRHV
jgi:hypothetical protein